VKKTFGDLNTDTFVETFSSVMHSSKFDRYLQTSIKTGTGIHWGKQIDIGKHVSSMIVPLPEKWANFIAHECKKEILVRSLSQQLILQTPVDQFHCYGLID
jgi:hypothetical protein